MKEGKGKLEVTKQRAKRNSSKIEELSSDQVSTTIQDDEQSVQIDLVLIWAKGT